MCGRYYLDTLPEALIEYFSISSTPALTASYNIAPTDSCPIVACSRGERRWGHARWGLVPAWAKDPKIGARMINARSETAAVKPAFRQAWAHRRCLVPASGFYEWRRLGSGKQPYLIAPAEGELLAFAGLWERWRDPAGGDPLVSFTILTTVPNRVISGIHDRMPVIISPQDQSRWLDSSSDGSELMAPCRDDLLRFFPVSSQVNSPRNNHPGLIEPLPEQSPADGDG